ncbi:type IV secretory pathway VirB10-like protein [Rhodoblastus acidophilus]|uniref:hypothetical protein n=1 Tax=Rhodoblastus acidophilus TaxID=1074 RepID=UPI0022242BDC|nr:hypothetical protein [Rhodoblastus acidophilus]MCW2314486.1 type IV secretory pathway VirB10-like protein [Rhodoblastus acidophilus]
MTGWFALTLIVAVVIAVATIFRFGQRAGGEAERAKAVEAENRSIKEVTDAQDRMLDASADAPRDRDEISSAGCAMAPSRPVVVCPPVSAYSRNFQARLADEVTRLPPGSATERALADYATMRDQSRACRERR